MRGDFTRDSFDSRKHFSRVLMQQGRVTLDADYNEQTDIFLHLLRTLTVDLIGPYGGPFNNGGFSLSFDPQNANVGFSISPGRYYVDGILIENETTCTYTQQPDLTFQPGDPLLAEIQKPSGKQFWIYLDVWERYITYLEDDSIREVALNGPDTCSRSKVVWQVKALPYVAPDIAKAGGVQPDEPARNDTPEQLTGEAKPKRLNATDCGGPLGTLVSLSNATMAAMLDPGKQSTDPCIQSPTAMYRGAENQLYRVEIHDGGTAGLGGATFKWSRDNGSVAGAWVSSNGQNQIQIVSARGFSAGDWVELSDDSNDLLGVTGTLVLVTKVDNGTLSIDPSTIPSSGPGISWSANLSNPKVRRWDQTQTGEITLTHGVIPIVEGTPAAPNWIDLEDGLQVQFTAGGVYRTGDYWLIPVRVAETALPWPSTTLNGVSTPAALPPDGIEHHYAPLGLGVWTAGSQDSPFTSCGCVVEPTNSCFRQASRTDETGAQATKT